MKTWQISRPFSMSLCGIVDTTDRSIRRRRLLACEPSHRQRNSDHESKHKRDGEHQRCFAEELARLRRLVHAQIGI
jgi:hypothetical protein